MCGSTRLFASDWNSATYFPATVIGVPVGFFPSPGLFDAFARLRCNHHHGNCPQIVMANVLFLFSLQLIFFLDVTEIAMTCAWVIVGGSRPSLFGLLLSQLVILTPGCLPMGFGYGNPIL